MPTVTYNIIPNARQFSPNRSREQKLAEVDQLKAAFAVGLIKTNDFDGEAIANDVDWNVNYGMPAAMRNDGRVKTWIYPQAFEAIQVGRDSAGNWSKVANTSDSLSTFEKVPRDVSDFYKLYRSHFQFIPEFVTVQYSKEEAERMQFGDGPAIDFPLGKMLRNDELVNFKPGLPQGIAYDFAPDGNLRWFKIAEYKAAHPFQVTGTIPPVNAVSDAVIVAGISMVVSSSLSPAEKVKQFKEILAKAR
jgi:hypothetical protein